MRLILVLLSMMAVFLISVDAQPVDIDPGFDVTYLAVDDDVGITSTFVNNVYIEKLPEFSDPIKRGYKHIAEEKPGTKESLFKKQNQKRFLGPGDNQTSSDVKR